MGEHPGPPRDGGREGGDPFVISPERALAEIEGIKTDPEKNNLWLSGDKAMGARMERLHRLAYPDPASS